jgi:hypothetical protein
MMNPFLAPAVLMSSLAFYRCFRVYRRNLNLGIEGQPQTVVR